MPGLETGLKIEISDGELVGASDESYADLIIELKLLLTEDCSWVFAPEEEEDEDDDEDDDDDDADDESEDDEEVNAAFQDAMKRAVRSLADEKSPVKKETKKTPIKKAIEKKPVKKTKTPVKTPVKTPTRKSKTPAKSTPTNTPKWTKRPWTSEEEKILTAGVKRYGDGGWAQILQDDYFGPMLEGRTGVNLKDKWRNLKKKGGKK